MSFDLPIAIPRAIRFHNPSTLDTVVGTRCCDHPCVVHDKPCKHHRRDHRSQHQYRQPREILKSDTPVINTEFKLLELDLV